MRVTIVVGGKWQAIQLGEQLEARGHLQSIITSHPRWAFQSPKIDPKKTLHFPLAEIVAQGINRLSRSDAGYYWKALLLDRFASRRVAGCDLLFGFASFCADTMRHHKGKRALALERACPHILEQAATLGEEASRLGLTHTEDPRIVDRMLAEYDLADVIIVPSKFSQNSFLARGFDPKKVRIATLAAKFPPPGASPNREGRTVFRLLFVGGNFLRKGLIYLLRAWDGLGLKNSELVLRASDLLMTSEVRRILANPTVRVVGHQADLTPLYSSASAFCLPSVDEGFGYVVLEAMSHGLPVIITRNVGAADCVREGMDGFVVNVRNPEALREKIVYLYEHAGERKSMGEAARAQALKFTWDAYGNEIMRIFSELPHP